MMEDTQDKYSLGAGMPQAVNAEISVRGQVVGPEAIQAIGDCVVIAVVVIVVVWIVVVIAEAVEAEEDVSVEMIVIVVMIMIMIVVSMIVPRHMLNHCVGVHARAGKSRTTVAERSRAGISDHWHAATAVEVAAAPTTATAVEAAAAPTTTTTTTTVHAATAAKTLHQSEEVALAVEGHCRLWMHDLS